MISRKTLTYDGDQIIEETFVEITWEEVRTLRNKELSETDWWALKDLTMSQAKKDYRKFLRDLPANYSTANEAADAWAEYEKPE